jgi:hypothetical protein
LTIERHKQNCGLGSPLLRPARIKGSDLSQSQSQG